MLFAVVEVIAEGGPSILTWSVESEERKITLDLSRDGMAQIQADKGSVRAVNFSRRQTEDLFEAAGVLMGALPDIMSQFEADKDNASIKRLGVSRQSSDVITTLRVSGERVNGRISIKNLSALIALMSDKALSDKLRQANDEFGASLSEMLIE
ncbi:MAG: hypothetical protein OIF56_05355 [Cohaesibacter sp.]|nr:hypothetical protein [Cohaesibacter sp.]